MSGQSIMDRMTAAKHSIAGQGLAKTVCKATTEEVMGPKKKHLDYLLQCTNEPNVSIPQLADLLIERTQSGNWVIVFKSLVTTQNLMNYGNERFTQYLASNNCTFNLGSFVDKTGVQGYDMSTFIRRYSKYLNEKAYSYRTMAFDFCKVKRGRDDGLLRTMSSEKLLKALPVLQGQIDALLEFDCTPNELTNGVINACFMLMFKDLIRLFACYNDGIINLLEKYFDMNKKQCKEALDIYKKFLVRMDKVSEFLKVAEKSLKSVGIDKGDIPDLAKGLKDNTTQAPASLLDALEQHLQSLEGKKGTTPTTTTAKPAGYTTAVNSISGNSAIQISEEEKKRILDEENNRLQQLKFGVSFDEHEPVADLLSDSSQEQKLKDSPSSAAAAAAAAPPSQSNNPFATSPTATNAAPTASPATVKPSQDLLNLTGNPFVENVQSVMNMNSATNAMQGQNAFGAPAWGQPATGGFGTDTNFATAFSSSNNSGMASLDVSTSVTSAVPLQPSPTITPSGFGDLALPPSPVMQQRSWTPTMQSESAMSGRTASPSPAAATSDTLTGFDAFGEVLTPHNNIPTNTEQMSAEMMQPQDLDSSLANLAGNLGINGANSVKKNQHQWQPKTDAKKTGGNNWSPIPVQSATWSQGFSPQPAQMGMMYGAGGMPAMGGQPMMNQMGQPMGPGMMAPGMGMPMGGGMGMPMGQQGMYQGMRPGMQPMGGMPRPNPPASQPNDPFGAL